MSLPLTAERLWQLLDYDDQTGLFCWRIDRSRTAKVGEMAGNVVDGYIKIMVDGKTYTAGRLAVLYMTGAFPSAEVDHIDTDRANNRWRNLRDVPHVTNTENRQRANASNKTGLLGVSQHHRSGRFRSRIMVDGKIRQLGWYDTPEEAHAVYVAAKRELHAGNRL